MNEQAQFPECKESALRFRRSESVDQRRMRSKVLLPIASRPSHVRG